MLISAYTVNERVLTGMMEDVERTEGVCSTVTRDAQYGRDAGVSAIPDCAQCGERAARVGKARVRRLGELRRLALGPPKIPRELMCQKSPILPIFGGPNLATFRGFGCNLPTEWIKGMVH